MKTLCLSSIALSLSGQLATSEYLPPFLVLGVIDGTDIEPLKIRLDITNTHSYTTFLRTYL